MGCPISERGFRCLEAELRLAVEHGASVSVTPEVEMQMGLGQPVTGRLLAAGGRPALGVDVVSAVAGDMFGQMRLAIQMERALANQKLIVQGETPQNIAVTARDALTFATLEAARALQLDDRIGSLTPGKQADLIGVRLDSLNLFPATNPAGTLVMAANPGDVDTVLVAGKVVKQGGRLVGVDLEHVRQLALESRDRILERAGFPAAPWLSVPNA